MTDDDKRKQVSSPARLAVELDVYARCAACGEYMETVGITSSEDSLVVRCLPCQTCLHLQEGHTIAVIGSGEGNP